MNDEKIHPMRIVARRTGLSSHTIRVWERRYQAVEPARTDTNRRLYSEADIERLAQLHQATQSGHSISQIARFSSEELATLITRDKPAAPVTNADTPRLAAPAEDPDAYVRQALSVVRQMDSKGLEAELFRAEVDMGRNKLLAKMVTPLMQQIGDLRISGDLRIADEHMATTVVRSFLGTLHSSAAPASGSPVAVITTPAGQPHEIGALIASLTASAAGWRVIYLGPNMPAEEIASVALQHQAQFVALSTVHFSDGARQFGAELDKLRRALGDQITIFVGGHNAGQYVHVIERAAAEHLPSLEAFSARLATLNAIPTF